MNCYRINCGCRGGGASDIHHCDCAALCHAKIVSSAIAYETETVADIKVPEGCLLTNYEKSVFAQLLENGLTTEEAINALKEM